MTDLVASGVLGDPEVDVVDFQPAIEQLRDFVAESMGGDARGALTISGGAIVPPAGEGGGVFTVDTEGLAASDTLSVCTLTNVPEGRFIRLYAANAARVVTIENANGGAGQWLLSDGNDFVFAGTDVWIEFQRRSTDMVEVGRSVRPPTVEWLTSGTAATYTTLAGAKVLEVELWGAGGGSGGVDGQVGGGAVSGPGAGGGYCMLEISAPAASYTYTVGAGGTAGSSGNNAGGAGGATTFADGGSVNMSAGGGAAGPGQLGTAGTSLVTGAAGGTSSGGDINLTGGDAGGKTIVGGLPSGLPVSGAAPILGGGVRPAINGAGVAGRTYGEGGGSAMSTDATNFAGAAGAGGLIKITTHY